MVNIKSLFDCCGCEACSQVCNRHAITMRQDFQGFYYPNVNYDLCNNCGLCEKICPLLNSFEERTPLHTYALKNKNEKVRMDSSSGGVFTILAEETIHAGGVVYGAVFDSDWSVFHERIDSIEGISRLRGSKYVQSRMDGVYQKVKEDLISGIPVLFSGCHCHIAALHSFLRKEYNNLTTVDVVCGGVPSPRIWQDYLREEVAISHSSFASNSISSTLNEKPSIKSVKFREKSKGWRRYHLSIQISESSQKDNPDSSCITNSTYYGEHTFMQSWLRGFISRPACHKCHFRCGRSGSDYTIADYWGIENKHPDFFDDKGVSILFVYNSLIPKSVLDKCDYIETSFNDAAEGQLSILQNKPYVPTSRIYYYLHDRINLNLSASLKICLFIESARNHIVYLRDHIHNIIRK